MNPNDLTCEQIAQLFGAIEAPDELDNAMDADELHAVDEEDQRLVKAGVSEADHLHYIAGLLSAVEEARVRDALKADRSLWLDTETARIMTSEDFARNRRGRARPQAGSPIAAPDIQRPDVRLAADSVWRFAAHDESHLPQTIRLDGMLPGLCGEASGSVVAPGTASSLRVSFDGPADPRPSHVPFGLRAAWPDGHSDVHRFEFRNKKWRAELEIPHRWPVVCGWLRDGKISFIRRE